MDSTFNVEDIWHISNWRQGTDQNVIHAHILWFVTLWPKGNINLQQLKHANLTFQNKKQGFQNPSTYQLKTWHYNKTFTPTKIQKKKIEVETQIYIASWNYIYHHHRGLMESGSQKLAMWLGRRLEYLLKWEVIKLDKPLAIHSDACHQVFIQPIPEFGFRGGDCGKNSLVLNNCTTTNLASLNHLGKPLQRTMDMDMGFHSLVSGFKEMGFCKASAALAFITPLNKLNWWLKVVWSNKGVE